MPRAKRSQRQRCFRNVKLVIKNPAPLGERLDKWGDYHFGQALSTALKRARQELEIRQDFWPEWDQEDDGDAVLVLRGKRQCRPTGRVPSFLWVLSHPSTVTPAEVAPYTHVFAASEALARHVEDTAGATTSVLRQCTDPLRFHPPDGSGSREESRRDGIIFVANSRGYPREIVRWALDAGLPPTIHGAHWDSVGLSHLVKNESVDNAQVAELYRGARATLNDHWADMRYYGIVNNRVLDALSAGLPTISDSFTELRDLFGGTLLYADGPREYLEAVQHLDRNYSSVLEKVARRREQIVADFSFQARAEELLAFLDRHGRHGAGPSTAADFSRAVTGGSELFETLCDAVEALQHRAGGMRRLLHLFPSPRREYGGPDTERFSYFTGGFGDGPWQLRLHQDVRDLEHMGFDLIVIEDAGSLDVVPPLGRHGFLQGLRRALSPGGTVAIRLDQLGPDWTARFRIAGFSQVGEADQWALLQSHQAATTHDKLRAVSIYAHTLEHKLAAVYRSRSWKLLGPVRRISGVLKRGTAGNVAHATTSPPRPPSLSGRDPLADWRPADDRRVGEGPAPIKGNS